MQDWIQTVHGLAVVMCPALFSKVIPANHIGILSRFAYQYCLTLVKSGQQQIN